VGGGGRWALADEDKEIITAAAAKAEIKLLEFTNFTPLGVVLSCPAAAFPQMNRR